MQNNRKKLPCNDLSKIRVELFSEPSSNKDEFNSVCTIKRQTNTSATSTSSPSNNYPTYSMTPRDEDEESKDSPLKAISEEQENEGDVSFQQTSPQIQFHTSTPFQLKSSFSQENGDYLEQREDDINEYELDESNVTYLKDRVQFLESENQTLKVENQILLEKITDLEAYSSNIIQEIARIEDSTKRVSEGFKAALEKSMRSRASVNERLVGLSKRTIESIESVSGRSEENEIGNNAVFFEGILQELAKLKAPTYTTKGVHKKCREKTRELNCELERYKRKVKEYEKFMKEVLGTLIDIEMEEKVRKRKE